MCSWSAKERDKDHNPLSPRMRELEAAGTTYLGRHKRRGDVADCKRLGAVSCPSSSSSTGTQNTQSPAAVRLREADTGSPRG